MGTNGNGHRPVGGNGTGNGNDLLTSRSVQELLTEFEETGRQEPFAEIVRRYAGMVYNVCYQVSRDSHEAEDATQAVFLTLAVRSKTAQKIQYLGPWLQRVAQRLSLDMKRSKKRRSAREMKHHDLNVGRWEEANAPADLGMDELRGILRDEIDKLPAKYRMPLILHYFGGLKPDELSKELGIKANTLGVRLHRARKMLGENLQRRGIVVGGAMLTAALASMIPFYVQSTVVNRTATAAAAWALGHHVVASEISANVLGLMRSAQRAAIMGKIKAVTAAVAIGVSTVAGAGELIQRFKPFGLELRNPLRLESIFGPLFERLRNPLRLSAADEQLENVLDAASKQHDLPGPGRLSGAWMNIPAAGQVATVDAASDPGARAALASAREQIVLQRTLVLPPIDPIPDPALPPSSPIAVSARAIVPPYQPARVIPEPVAATAVIAAPSAQQRFSEARGTYTHPAGALDLPTISIDSRTSPVQFMAITGGSVRAHRLAVAESGAGEIVHSGGAVSVEELAIGVNPGASGVYRLSDTAELSAGRQEIGIAGAGALVQTGGINHAETLTLGAASAGNGTYEISGGKVYAQNVRIGLSGNGVFRQSGGETVVDSSLASTARSPGGEPVGMVVAMRANSSGQVNISGGSLTSDNLVVGFSGDASFYQQAGTTTATTVVLAGGDDAAATLRAIRGNIVFDAGDAAPRAGNWRERLADRQSLFNTSAAETHAIVAAGRAGNALIVGNGGDAVLELGNRHSTARLTEATPDAFTPIIVGATPSAEATFVGYGDVGLTGPLVQNGRVIADGFGRTGRSLDFSSLAMVENTIENPPAGQNGWLAQRGGALRLPALPVPGDGSYNWGESPRDEQPDLVNSARFTFTGVASPGRLDVALLSPESALFEPGAPVGEIFVGFWKLNESPEASQVDLLVRYDQRAISKLGLHERDLNLWGYTEDQRWIALADELALLDVDENLIGGSFDGSLRYFAVGVPSRADTALSNWLTIAMQPDVSPTMMFAGVPEYSSSDIVNFAREVAMSAAGPAVASVPEPAAGALLACGAALLARRRRHP